MLTPKTLQEYYNAGKNISEILRNEYNTLSNTSEIIEIAYDLQSGSYTKAMQNADVYALKQLYSQTIAQTILSLDTPCSLLEAGIGEATTLSGVIKHMGYPLQSYGFDISWSRVAHAKKWLEHEKIFNHSLCTGDLLHIPFGDDSIDVVYTSHSIEPNGGSEEPILKELYRVAKKYLILLEPGYELANSVAKERMDSHGYCKNLVNISLSLGYDVIKHSLFPHTINPLNPTAITIIRKNNPSPTISQDVFACPKYKTPLEKINEVYFSPEALSVYPIIGGIPCLRVENSVFASKYKDFFGNATVPEGTLFA